jgi:hypothetical protein
MILMMQLNYILSFEYKMCYIIQKLKKIGPFLNYILN